MSNPAYFTHNTTTVKELVAAVSGKSHYITDFTISGDGTNNFFFQSASTQLTGNLRIGTNHVVYERAPKGEVLFKTNAGEALNIKLGSAVKVDGHLRYFTA